MSLGIDCPECDSDEWAFVNQQSSTTSTQVTVTRHCNNCQTYVDFVYDNPDLKTRDDR